MCDCVLNLRLYLIHVWEVDGLKIGKHNPPPFLVVLMRIHMISSANTGKTRNAHADTHVHAETGVRVVLCCLSTTTVQVTLYGTRSRMCECPLVRPNGNPYVTQRSAYHEMLVYRCVVIARRDSNSNVAIK